MSQKRSSSISTPQTNFFYNERMTTTPSLITPVKNSTNKTFSVTKNSVMSNKTNTSTRNNTEKLYGTGILNTLLTNENKPDREDNIHVLIRVRPPLPMEIPKDLPFRSIVLTNISFNNCSLVEYLGSSNSEKERQREWVENPEKYQIHRFSFDFVFDMDASQHEVYNKTAKPAVNSILEGYNSTIFAYGQTGTGKTFTMEGFTYNALDDSRGIIPRCIEEIFEYIENFKQSDTKFMVRASYLQIYNETVSDLLKTERSNLQIREDKKKGLFVEVTIFII